MPRLGGPAEEDPTGFGVGIAVPAELPQATGYGQSFSRLLHARWRKARFSQDILEQQAQGVRVAGVAERGAEARWRLHDRIAHETERGAKPAAIQALEGKILRVQAERDIRLRNIRDRFKVQPVGARLLILPTYRLRIQPYASSEPSALIEYCPVLREFLPVSCPSCGHSTRDLVLKSKQYLCPRCA